MTTRENEEGKTVYLAMNPHLRQRLLNAVRAEDGWDEDTREKWIELLQEQETEDGDESIFNYDPEDEEALGGLVDYFGLAVWASVLDADECEAVGYPLNADPDGRTPLVQALLTTEELLTLSVFTHDRERASVTAEALEKYGD